MTVIEPDWPLAGQGIGALTTTRDDRGSDLSALPDPAAGGGDALLPERRWLRQVHGSRVISLADWQPGVEADAAWTNRAGEIVAIQTADCLPILIADRDATVVAGVHGGWRSLAAGIIAKTLAALPVAGRDLCAWIGPAICWRCYQVGGEVRASFLEVDAALADGFKPDGDRWRADLKWIAAYQLRLAGVEVYDCKRCTFEETDTFYSFRREGKAGRLVSVIWLDQ